MENQNEIYVKIFVGVKFEQKDLAKENGAKWDVEKKSWYFKYLLTEFLNDNNKHTCQFKPFRVEIYVLPEEERKNEMKRCYDIAQQRHIKFQEEINKIMNTVIY